MTDKAIAILATIRITSFPLNQSANAKRMPSSKILNLRKTLPKAQRTSQDYSSQFTNLEHITISAHRLSINFKISTKHQHLD